MLSRLTPVLSAALLLGSLAAAQSTSTSTKSAAGGAMKMKSSGNMAGTLSSTDHSYLMDNAQGSVYDQALAELGYLKGNTPAIRTYARRVVLDHNRLNLQLLRLGQRYGVMLPLTIQASDSSRLQNLMGMSGAAFDKAFLQEEQRINADDVSKSAQELKTTQNSGVRRFVTDFHSTEERHLQEAKSLMNGKM